MSPLIPAQLALPVHGLLPEVDPASEHCQRWNQRRHSFTRRRDGGFDAARYVVLPVDERTAKTYVTTNHYSGTYPVAVHRFGLYLRCEAHEPPAPPGLALVGVAVFGIPASVGVLTNRLPDLAPYTQALTLDRLVLEGEPQSPGHPGGRAPANAETWFLAACLRRLAEVGVRAVVSFSDPVPRVVGGRVLFPGHLGVVYQASSAIFTGRTKPRWITVLPDGTTLSDRSLAKVRAQDVGHEYVERRLIALGARPRLGGAANAASWLRDALDDAGALRLRHGGQFSYVLPTPGNRRGVRIAGSALPYPKHLTTPTLAAAAAAAP